MITPEDVGYWRELSTKALMIEIETPRTFKESVDLFRIGKREVNANPYGIDFSGPMFETLHLTELLAERIEEDGLELGPHAGLVTYHDPCRMSRYQSILEPPRTVITSVPGLEFVEMEDNRERSMCCGSTAWVNCSGCSKLIQREKLRQAKSERDQLRRILDGRKDG